MIKDVTCPVCGCNMSSDNKVCCLGCYAQTQKKTRLQVIEELSKI